MWIKWYYNDHGHGGWKELEVPNESYYQTDKEIRDYIIDTCNIPTWSERYCESRIKFERIDSPTKETVEKKISGLKSSIKSRREHVKELENLLKQIKSKT